jgi:hypothetical protein
MEVVESVDGHAARKDQDALPTFDTTVE